MKTLAFTAAAAALALTLIGAAGASSGIDRMVGGGWITDVGLDNPDLKVREGMELWCAVGDPNIRNSNLQITWGRGNYFHLTELNSVACSGNNPLLRDDGGQITGFGEGRCNGQQAFISFQFIDNPDYRTGDTGSVEIEGTDPDVCALNVTGTLLGGNFTFIEDPNI